MPTFVHITSEDIAKKVKRGGIRAAKMRGEPSRGIFAMPVTRNFQISHQWVREMKRGRRKMVVGVYFRVPDAELVWVGRYNGEHQQMTAAQAAKQVMSETNMSGVEVIIPRRIEPTEILRVRQLPQLVGWRHYPEAHGKRPWACECCQKGEFGSRKIRERLGKADA